MKITTELLAAYAEGNVSDAERTAVRRHLVEHPEQMETVMMMMDNDVDIQLEQSGETIHTTTFQQELDSLLEDINALDCTPALSKGILPMLSMAAQSQVDNLCAIRCEVLAMRKLGIDASNEELIKEATKDGILKAEGTPLYNIGHMAGTRGLNIAHRYKCSLSDIAAALIQGDVVLAVVDNFELQTKSHPSLSQDKAGFNPNHVVLISSLSKDSIQVIDASISTATVTYPLSQFVEAWNDSSNYLIIVSKNNIYQPYPIDLSDVPLSDDLLELREAIAENAHEVWAFNRMQEGWSYGPFRDDENKLHPDLVPYNRLPDSEKEYDRQMAINTIKLVKKLGWTLSKRT